MARVYAAPPRVEARRSTRFTVQKQTRRHSVTQGGREHPLPVGVGGRLPWGAMSAADFSAPLPQAVGAAGASDGVGGLRSLLAELLSREVWAERLARVAELSKSFFNPLEFSRPTSQADWISRVSGNASRFASIYFLFFLPILLRQMLSSWWLRIGSLLLLALWAYGYIHKKEESVLILCGVPLPKVMACSIGSVIIMLMTGMLNALIGALMLFALIGMPHMSLHIAAPSADAMDAVELQAIAAQVT